MTNSSTKPSSDIFEAIENDDLAAVKDFVEVKQVPANSTTAGKRTTAHVAAKKDRLEIFKYFVNADASLIKTENVYGYPPLFTAIEAGALDIVKYLVEECEVSITKHNKRQHGNAPIHIAAREGQLEVLKYLVKCDKEVDVDAVNEFGETACFMAAAEGHPEVIKFLAGEMNADLYHTDSKKENILFVCAAKGDLKIVKYILDERKLKFDVNQKDGLGRSLAYLVAGSRHLDFLKYLVGEKGADVNSSDRSGRTVLHEAAVSGDIHAVKYLIEKGADPKSKDHRGKTPGKLTKDIMMKKYLEKLEEKESSRRRRDIVFESINQCAKRPTPLISNSIDDWSQKIGVTNRLLTTDSRGEFQERSNLHHHCISSPQVNSLLVLLGTWVKRANPSKFEGTKYWSSLTPPETLKNRMDSLALAAIMEESHT